MPTPSPANSPPATNSTEAEAPTKTTSPPPTKTAPPPTKITAPPPTKTNAPPPSKTNTPPPATPTSPPPRSTPSAPPPSHSPPNATTRSPPAATPRPSTPARLPPPPTHRRNSPSPPPPKNSSNSVPPAPSYSPVSMGLVIGVAVAGVLVLVLLSFLFVFCCKKRKRRYNESSGYYIPPPTSGHKDDPYSQHWRHNLPPPDHAFMRPSMYSLSAVAALTPQSPSPLYMPPQPPPPPLMSSSGGSRSNYSGSDAPLPPPSSSMAMSFAKSSFSYEELAMATDGFSNANLLGQGGFGFVHRGVLPNGKDIAVKQLKAGSGQGEREFQAEVEIISRVHHRHLVSLVGYCITGPQRMLVYEFVTNNTLEFHLHGKGRPTMDWPTRLKIALGSAKGLAYLHEDCHPKIIHRDIKAANILLDFKFEAKVADFGLAKFTSDVHTHVSTRVMGTFGYMAPEYASSGKLTDKSDVFSFGVVLLELITGRLPVDSDNTFMDGSLVDWARPLLVRAMEDGDFDALVDERLHNVYNSNEMARMVACAAACVRHSARRRPRLSQIVRALEGDVSLTDLNDGITPGQTMVYSSYESSDYGSRQYNEDMKRFRKMAEYSSEYSGASSEYCFNPTGSSSETRQTTREMEMGQANRDSRCFNGSS